MVAVPRAIPDPVEPTRGHRRATPHSRGGVGRVGPRRANDRTRAREHWDIARPWLIEAELNPYFWRDRGQLPWVIAMSVPGVYQQLGRNDFVRGKGERHRLPLQIDVDDELAWVLGMYVAEGYRRANQVVISNTVQERLDRIEAAFARFDIPLYEERGCGHLLLEAREQRLLVVGHGRQSAHEAGPRRRLRMVVGADRGVPGWTRRRRRLRSRRPHIRLDDIGRSRQ